MINASYAAGLPQASTQKYPSIQATEYSPKSSKTAISMGLSESNLEFLGDADKIFIQALPRLELTYTSEDGKEEDVVLYNIDSLRWVPLGIPEIQFLNKKLNKYYAKEKGVDHVANGCVTATRLLVCALKPDKTLILSSDGTPQPFMLKLTSTKCGIVKGAKKDPDLKSLLSLNEGIAKHFKLDPKSLWLHCCSIVIKPVARLFQGKEKSSFGVMFTLDSAQELPEDMQAFMFKFIHSEEIQDFLQDPFNVIEKEAASKSFDSDEEF